MNKLIKLLYRFKKYALCFFQQCGSRRPRLLPNLTSSTQEVPSPLPWEKKPKTACVKFFHRKTLVKKQILTKAKKLLSKQKSYLKDYPWYLVMGSKGSGKSSCCLELGNIPGNSTVPEYLKDTFVGVDFLIADNSVFLECGVQDTQRDTAVLAKKLTSKLKRQNRKKPLSGIIYTLSLNVLCGQYGSVWEKEIIALKIVVEELNRQCSIEVPIYFFVTKLDAVLGFNAFFQNMHSEDAKLPLGFLLPAKHGRDGLKIGSQLKVQFSTLIENLQEQTLMLLAKEKNTNQRQVIFLFLKQIEYFSSRICSWLEALFEKLNSANSIVVRGVFFSSVKQQANPTNFLSPSLEEDYFIEERKLGVAVNKQRSYFLSKTLENIILPESHLLGLNKKYEHHQQIKSYVTIFVFPFLFVVFSLFLFFSYRENSLEVSKVEKEIIKNKNIYQDNYPVSLRRGKVLERLDRVSNIIRLNKKNFWLKSLLVGHYLLSFELDKLQQRQIKELLLPPAAIFFQHMLNKSDVSVGDKFWGLAGYLAFSQYSDVPFQQVSTSMGFLLKDQSAAQKIGYKDLLNYLQKVTVRNPVYFPLDRSLISRTRYELSSLGPLVHARALLTYYAHEYGVTPLSTISFLGAAFFKAFPAVNLKNPIPGLFTEKGFLRVYKVKNSTIVQTVIDDNNKLKIWSEQHERISKAQLLSQLNQYYAEKYTAIWKAWINDLSLQRANTLTQLIAEINQLTSQNSPLKKALNFIHENTSTISGSEISVNEQFLAVNQYIQKHQSLKETFANLNALRDYLSTIRQSSDVGLAALNAARNYIKSVKGNPIATLREQAKNAPYPLKQWLNTLADNAWQLILQQSQDEVHRLFHQKISLYFNAYLQGKYPFYVQSTRQASVDKFKVFFGYSGIMQTFFDTYIKDFVDTRGEAWVSFKRDGLGLALSTLDLKRFKQANTITQQYFKVGTDKFSRLFLLAPKNLDGRAISLNLSIAGKNIFYQHGPIERYSITWPFPKALELISIKLCDFDEHCYIRHYDGPWSLFRWLDDSKFSVSIPQEEYKLALVVHGYKANFSLLSAEPFSFWTLQSLKGFRLPQL